MKYLIPSLSLLCLLNACAVLKSHPQDELITKGNRLTQAFYQGKMEQLWGRMSPKMKGVFKTKSAWLKLHEQVLQQMGAETKLIQEKAFPSKIGFSHYYRQATFEKTAQSPLLFYWALDTQSQIVGMKIQAVSKAAKSPYLDYQSPNAYHFPIQENAFIVWGGRNIEQNYHVATPNQRFAYDIGVIKNGGIMKKEGKHNSDYPCFGFPVYAPAKGEVIASENTIIDNIPGQQNAKAILGNHVVIAHGNDEYSYLAHLKQGSVLVSKGQKVTSETQVGQCGNSGFSTEPHVHYHLQDHAEFRKGKGKPLQFLDIEVNGQWHRKYEPQINQVVKRAKLSFGSRSTKTLK